MRGARGNTGSDRRRSLRARLGRVLAQTAFGLVLAAAAQAQELPVTHLKVVGGLGNVSQYTNIEEPFWTHELASLSGGRITAELTPFDTIGLRMNDIMQLMRLGVITMGT